MNILGKLGTRTYFVGVLLIPFDNLAFAPSAGWAAVSPYLFLVSAVLLLLAGNDKPSPITLSPYAFTAGSTILISTFISMLYFEVEWRTFALAATKLVLGLAFFYSTLACREKINGDIEIDDLFGRKFINRLTIGYSTALFFGLLQLGAKYGVLPTVPFDLLFARYYPEKVQFSFTEPSFASLHAIGVIATSVIVFGSKRNRNSLRIAIIGSSILAISIFSGSSLRALVDAAAFALILVIWLPLKTKIKILTPIALIGVALATSPPDALKTRIDKIRYERADPSTLIRSFRTEAAIRGMLAQPYTTLFGFGFGNSALAISSGYWDVPMNITDIPVEIIQLEYEPDGLTYNLHAKFLAEFGFVGYLCLLIAMADRRRKVLASVIALCYLQFDSLAFYPLWIYLFAKRSGLGLDRSISAPNHFGQRPN